MKRLLIIIIPLMFLMSSCNIVREDQLVILENDDKEADNGSDSLINIPTDSVVQKTIVEKNSQLLRILNLSKVPLSVSQNYNTIIAYENIPDLDCDIVNSKVVTGNMIGKIKLFAVNVKKQTNKEIGTFISLRDYKFDATGTKFAFIDGSGNVYIYNIDSDQVQKILSNEKYRGLSSLSWSRDSKRLMFDTKIIFDIASKEFISIAAESLTPFIKYKFNNNSYITQMKNLHYYDMITLYDFNNKNYTFIANGIYQDCDSSNVLYTKNYMNSLNIINLKTMENKLIHDGQIYNAQILKSTGDIVYSTVNPNLKSWNRYLIVKLNPITGSKKTLETTSPTFYLSPAEDKLYFISDYSDNSISINIRDFSLNQSIIKNDSSDLYKIKTTIIKMFQLDYNFKGSYEDYEAQAKKIYVNSYDLCPQEALENKLIDFKRFNAALPGIHKETYYIPSDININPINLVKNHASVNLGFFFLNSLELIKIYDDWYITGFSTHPQSAEVKAIRKHVEKYLTYIKQKNINEALKYCKNDENIQNDLIMNADKLSFRIGEIELWAMSDPHRSEYSDTSTEAKVKIIVSEGSEIKKYKLILSRSHKKDFEIIDWDINPLSISQLY